MMFISPRLAAGQTGGYSFRFRPSVHPQLPCVQTRYRKVPGPIWLTLGKIMKCHRGQVHVHFFLRFVHSWVTGRHICHLDQCKWRDSCMEGIQKCRCSVVWVLHCMRRYEWSRRPSMCVHWFPKVFQSFWIINTRHERSWRPSTRNHWFPMVSWSFWIINTRHLWLSLVHPVWYPRRICCICAKIITPCNNLDAA